MISEVHNDGALFATKDSQAKNCQTRCTLYFFVAVRGVDESSLSLFGGCESRSLLSFQSIHTGGGCRCGPRRFTFHGCVDWLVRTHTHTHTSTRILGRMYASEWSMVVWSVWSVLCMCASVRTLARACVERNVSRMNWLWDKRTVCVCVCVFVTNVILTDEGARVYFRR